VVESEADSVRAQEDQWRRRDDARGVIRPFAFLV
jgi:hypothetical protein